MNDEERILSEWNEEIDKALRRFNKRPALERAEIIIREYCKVMGASEEIDMQFQQWLSGNAMLALETDALEEYFNRVVAGETEQTECRI